MRNYILLFIFSFISVQLFAQKTIDNDANYIGDWTYGQYNESFIYNPSPIPFAFSDEMVVSHFKEVWGFDIFSKFPSYPKFNPNRKETPTDEDVVIYLNEILLWEKNHPSFKKYLENN